MSNVKITVTDKVRVECPYDDFFNEGARGIGGKFINGKWEFATRHAARVRELCFDAYGTDGTPQPTVTLHCNLDHIYLGNEFKIGAIQVLKKWERDRTPTVGADCAVIAGKLKSRGGSRNHPTIEHESGTVIEVTNVPLLLARKLIEEEPEAYRIIEEAEVNIVITAAEKCLIDALLALEPQRRALVMAEVRHMEES